LGFSLSLSPLDLDDPGRSIASAAKFPLLLDREEGLSSVSAIARISFEGLLTAFGIDDPSPYSLAAEAFLI
jgi:hypothetical protein